MASTHSFPELSHSQQLSDNSSLQDPTKLNQVMHRLCKLSQKQPFFTLTTTRDTEPHDTVNTRTSLCLCFPILNFPEDFEIPFGAQGPSPPVPWQQTAATLNGSSYHLPTASVSQDPCAAPLQHFIFPDQAVSASKNPSCLQNPNVTTWRLCLGSSWEGNTVLI